ncbi:hypothetical protein COV19_01400 [Candidatus Woesearchaeota archaeon CG10_big_fil_rev_8_21_14_0_10_44_13]|nr:MAG: hypothetical protein COV19_01400 [Candidatus Woesearchaeota archaeon CG10_big_fil_rev_8_21_14_0_10_44_13]
MPHQKILEIRQQTDNDTVNLALDTISIGKQALVFVNTKRGAEKAAEDIASKIKFDENNPILRKRKQEWEQTADEIIKVLPRPTKQCERLGKCIRKGIAFHHAGLAQKQKTIIEDAFRQNILPIICCTPTLAAGMDLPAFRVILRDLKRYGLHGLNWIPVLEYEQMAGRCGRPKYDKYGEAIAVATTENEKKNITDVYINGEVEEIYSKLAVEPVLRTYILSLIASEFVGSEESLFAFFEKTFWAHQFKDMKKLEKIIRKMIKLLEDFGFIKTEKTRDEFVSADKLKGGRLEATIVGKRVAQLYIDPLTANGIITALKKAESKSATDFSFLQLASSCLEMRPLLRIKAAEYEDVNGKLNEHQSDILIPEPSMYDPDYEHFLHSIKTAMFLEDWCDEKDEEELLEKYSIRPGEIRVKLELADWLLYSTEELARMMKKHAIIKDIIKVRLRLKYGVKEELITLLKLEGIGRVRARKLYNNRIKDLGDVKNADIMVLVQIVGKNTALSIKKQVGQDIEKEKIPEGKRKGQISLKDYQI